MKVAFGIAVVLMLSVAMVTAYDMDSADAAEPPISDVSYNSDLGGLIIEVSGSDGKRVNVGAYGSDDLGGSAVVENGKAIVQLENQQGSTISEGVWNLRINMQLMDEYTCQITVCELRLTSEGQSHDVYLSTGSYTIGSYEDYGFSAPEDKTFGGWMFEGSEVEAGSEIGIVNDGVDYSLTASAIWTNDPVDPDDATVTIGVTGDGTVSVTCDGSPIQNGATVPVGSEIVITATAGEDYELTSLTVDGEDFPNGGTHTVDGDVTIAATFTKTTGTTYYDVTVNRVAGGTATANPARAEAGTTVNLSVDLDEGYVLTGWEVISGDITIENNTFVMPASDVTVEPVIEEITIPVTGVTVSGAETAIEGTTGQYTATVQPEDATYGDIVWSVSDDTVATVDQNGKVRFLTPGPVTITATAGGVSGSITVEVSERSPKSISAVVGVYDEGDTFNWDDVTVTVHYDNGQSETITDGFTIDLADGTLLDTPGTIETTVHYNNLECTLEVTVRAPGQVAITVNVVGGGLFEGATLYWGDESRTITTYGTILVDEGTQVTLFCDGLFPPTVTVDGQIVDSYYTFTALKDMTFMVMFPTDDDDDDEPVNPSTPVQDGDDDSTTYIVAIASAAVAAILAALILMQTRKS